jgi:hypothetical protein
MNEELSRLAFEQGNNRASALRLQHCGCFAISRSSLAGGRKILGDDLLHLSRRKPI